MVTGVQAGDKVTVITNNSSLNPKSGFKSEVSTTQGNPLENGVVPYTHVLTVSESGNAVFQSDERYNGLQSVKITRYVTESDPYVGYALNAYMGSDLAAAQENMEKGVAGVSIVTTDGSGRSAAVFGSKVSNLALDATSSANGGFFSNSNLATGYVDNGINYIPLYMAQGQYEIAAENVNSATMYLYTEKGNTVKVTYPATDGSETTVTLTTDLQEIKFAPTTGKTITVDGGYAYAVFFVNRSIKATATVNILESIAWNPGIAGGEWQGENTLKNFVTVSSNSDAISATDVYGNLSIDIQPVFSIWNAQNSKISNFQPLNTTRLESYGQMPDWLFNQLTAIQNNNVPNSDVANKVDAWYLISDGATQFAPASLDENGTLNPGGNFPCSGKYKIIVTTSNPNVNIEHSEQTIDIYPSTNLRYTYQLGGRSYENEGMNISGYTVNQGGITALPAELSESELSKMVLYTPGVYPTATNPYQGPHGNMYYSLLDETVSSIDGIKWTAMTPEDGPIINLSNLTTSADKYLYLKLEKNGSVTPDKEILQSYITLRLDTNTPTGVEGIEAEGDAAVYYNLQGVRVDNPQNGIYVKVAGGKASKIIL